jgi:hypothetical protein
MQSIEGVQLTEFQQLVLEALVPAAAQKSIPQSIKIWNEIVESTVGAAALRRALSRATSANVDASEYVRIGIGAADPDVLFLKDSLYQRIGNSEAAIRAFFSRTVTSANEQCPYWVNSAYAEKPKCDL